MALIFMNCIFCKIAQKEIACDIIYEDDTTFAFLDIEPRAPGHTIVIPKIHAATITDLSDKDIASLFKTVKTVVSLLKHARAPDGFTIGINHGESAGQVVQHIHIHIIPRWRNDGGISIQGVVNNKQQETND